MQYIVKNGVLFYSGGLAGALHRVLSYTPMSAILTYMPWGCNFVFLLHLHDTPIYTATYFNLNSDSKH